MNELILIISFEFKFWNVLIEYNVLVVLLNMIYIELICYVFEIFEIIW